VSTLRCLPHACRQSSETCYARLCHGLRHIRVNCWRMFCACARAHSRLRVCARLCVCPRACMRLLARARARTWCCVTHRDAVCTDQCSRCISQSRRRGRRVAPPMIPVTVRGDRAHTAPRAHSVPVSRVCPCAVRTQHHVLAPCICSLACMDAVVGCCHRRHCQLIEWLQAFNLYDSQELKYHCSIVNVHKMEVSLYIIRCVF
jgi:hypothetical protein